jgi:plasmid stabilization system protein ParE
LKQCQSQYWLGQNDIGEFFEPHRSRGVRWISAGNYQVFFIINEATCQVHILRILYARRLWERLL